MITDAYKAFVEGIPDFFISPNFIPVYNFIMDVGSNPVETLMQAIYNIVLLIPFGIITSIITGIFNSIEESSSDNSCFCSNSGSYGISVR